MNKILRFTCDLSFQGNNGAQFMQDFYGTSS